MAREGARAVVPGPRGCFHPGGRGCSGLSPRAEVLGIPAPSKDSPQLGSRPSTAPTQAASPWKLQRRPGEVGAETQRSRGWGVGVGGGSVFFKPFPAFQA